MKKLYSLLLVILLVLSISSPALAAPLMEGYERVGESSLYRLWFDPVTTDVAVEVKSTGKLWTALPDENALASVGESARKNVLSVAELRFINNKMKEFNFTSYSDAVQKNQFTSEAIDNGIAVTFRMGTMTENLLIPMVMERKRFEEIFASMDASAQSIVKSNYTLYEYEATKNNETVLQRIMGLAPNFPEYDLYAIKKTTEAQNKKITKAFFDAGLTIDEIRSQYELLGYEQSDDTEYPLFQLTLEFTISDYGLRVRLPAESISFDREKYTLDTVTILKFFGCVPSGGDGYILVPDGSGALIALDTPASTTYNKKIYGNDYSYLTQNFTGYEKQSVLPVFGLADGNHAFVATIDGCEANASVISASSSINYGLNIVAPVFNVTALEFYRMESKMDFGMIRHSDIVLDEDAVITYRFLSDKDADYNGMAAAVRDYYFSGRERLYLNELPFYLETYGSIDTTKRVLGFPVSTKQPLTTFSQAKTMLEELSAAGVKGLNFIFKGWFNGGMVYNTPSSISVQSELGGKKLFNELIRFTKEQNIGFFPDADFLYVDKTSAFDGFNVSNDAARTLGGQSAKKYDYHPATLRIDVSTGRYVVSPAAVRGLADKFIARYSSFDLKSLSLGYIGSDLNSDFKRKNEIPLSSSKKINSELLDSLTKDGYELLIHTGNLYALSRSSHVMNLPNKSSSYITEYMSIPFVQMVIHGYVSYAGEPLSMGQDNEGAFLRSVAYGEGLYYLLIAASPSTVKDTPYAGLFGAQYNMWAEKAAAQYEQANRVLGDLMGQTITYYKEPETGISVTGYENGAKIVVNYTNEHKLFEGKTIPSRSFERID